MESRVVYKGPPNDEGYGTLNCADLSSATADGVGCGFIGGTVIGFFYNFIKPNTYRGFESRFGNALIKAPCIGGNLALFSLGHCLSRIAYFKYKGETPHGDTIPYEIHCVAIGGAFGFARYGLRGASLAALTSAGVIACYLVDEVYRTRYGSSICKTNTYSYPHYHPLLDKEDDDILQRDALLYDSKLLEY